MSTDLKPEEVLWAPVVDKYWPAIVKRVEKEHCSVQLLGNHPFAISELHVPPSKLINYQLNIHHACVHDVTQRELLFNACTSAQNSGLPEQRALFAFEPFKNFLSLLQSKPNSSNWGDSEQEDNFILPILNKDANEDLCVAHNHLRATDAALRSKRVESNHAKNNLIVQELRKIAVQCRSLAIERENKLAKISSREVEDEVATLKLSRKAALTYYRTLQPPPPPETVAQDLERAKNEAAHWKRQYEEVQKELSADKRRKIDNSIKEEEIPIPKANGEVKMCEENEKSREEKKDGIITTENGFTPNQSGEQVTLNNSTTPANEASSNLQMVAEVLSSMRTTAQSNFETKSDVQSNSCIRKQSNTPENATKHVKRRSRSNPSTPNPTKTEASLLKPHSLMEAMTNLLGAPKDNGEKTVSNATLDDTPAVTTVADELDVRNSAEGMKPYVEAKRNIGIKMLSKKHADCNPSPNDPARAFIADLDAFQDEHGEKAPKQMKIDGGPLCSYRLMRIVCGHGGIRNVVQNGQMRSVMYEVGVKKVTNSTRIKCYYAQNLYRYEHMLVHGVLLPKGVGEQIKSLTWRKGRTLAGTFSSDVPMTEVAQVSASTVGDNTSDHIDNNFAK